MVKVVAVELSSGRRCGDRSIEEGTHVHTPGARKIGHLAFVYFVWVLVARVISSSCVLRSALARWGFVQRLGTRKSSLVMLCSAIVSIQIALLLFSSATARVAITMARARCTKARILEFRFAMLQGPQHGTEFSLV